MNVFKVYFTAPWWYFNELKLASMILMHRKFFVEFALLFHDPVSHCVFFFFPVNDPFLLSPQMINVFWLKRL